MVRPVELQDNLAKTPAVERIAQLQKSDPENEQRQVIQSTGQKTQDARGAPPLGQPLPPLEDKRANRLPQRLPPSLRRRLPRSGSSALPRPTRALGSHRRRSPKRHPVAAATRA